MNFERYWKGKTKVFRQNSCANDTFPKPQTRQLANNRLTYSNTLFLKLIAIYIYIYSLSSYLADDTVFPSERPMGEWRICRRSKSLSRMRRNTKMQCAAKKTILIFVKTSRLYTNCQGIQRQLFFTKRMLSKMKWPVKLSLNSSISNHIKSVSGYLRITTIRAEVQDGFSRRFAHMQTFLMRHTFKCLILPRVSSGFYHFWPLLKRIFLSLPTIKFVMTLNKTEKHKLLQSMAT